MYNYMKLEGIASLKLSKNKRKWSNGPIYN